MQFRDVVAGVEVSTVVCGSIATVFLEGEITPTSLAAVKDAVLVRLAQVGLVVGFLVHFERADVRCTPAELTAIFDGEGQFDQATAPAAMVVSDRQVALFRLHSWEAAWRGIVRQAFTDAAKARQWLTSRAETAAQARANL